MKKVLLLALLLVVAASAAITIEFPDGDPSTVGVPVRVIITSGSATEVDLFVNPGTVRWVDPPEVTLGDDFEFDGDIEITRPGTGLTLFASKGAENGESESFDVVAGSATKWQILAPGETADPGNPYNTSGKTGSPSVTAAVLNPYTVDLCDTWYNVVNDEPTGYTITPDDPFGRVTGDNVELRTAPGSPWTVTVSGTGYTNDVSNVSVVPGDATQLLIKCSGETHVPGDTFSVAQKGGKTGDPARAIVGGGYEVDVYAVDDAWNINSSATGNVYVNGGVSGGVTSDTVALSGGQAEVTAVFQIAAENGKDIYASTTDGNLETEYPTKVIVSEGVLFIEPSLDPSLVPIGVHSVLSVLVYADSATTISNYPVYISVVEEDLKQNVDCSANTSVDGWFMYTDPNKADSAKADVWASAETTYTIRVTAGQISEDLTFTVKELTGLLVAPNPFKYGSPGHSTIDFNYKVAEGGAAEIVLLIADIYGNVVYRATYGQGEPKAVAGQQTISWDGLNSNGTRVASGMYQAVMKITLTNLSSETLKKNFMVIW
jgi:hypothetical protein